MKMLCANPVIASVVLDDETLIKNMDMNREIHKDIQAANYTDDAREWEAYILYLMLVGDCFAREIRRRGLDVKTNEVLASPRDPIPVFWRTILVPESAEKIPNQITDDTPWYADKYPEPEQKPEVAETAEEEEEKEEAVDE